MMTSSKLYFVFPLLVILISCGNNQNEKTDIDFKNYFFQPDWFDDAKVYEYEVIANDTLKYFAYRYFEKAGENKLRNTIYDKDFNINGIAVYEYLPDKVTIHEITTIETWNNNIQTKEDLTDNVVFVYNKMNEEFGFTHSGRFKNEPNITKYVTRNLKKTGKRVFEGKEVNVVIADGNTKLIAKSEKYPEDLVWNSKEKLIYADKVGVIYQDYKNKYNQIITKLNRILSKQEFERMKSEH